MNLVVGSDADNELGYAISKASVLAKETRKLIYIYSDGLLFYATDKFPTKSLVAKCYPGGRKELKRVLSKEDT